MSEQLGRPARRRFLIGATAAVLASGAGAASARSARELDRAVGDALSDLFRQTPKTRRLAADSYGVLVMPDILEAGFIIGGLHGEGALIVGERTDSYWAYTAGTVGFQAGGQRIRQALFFMTADALDRFRESDNVVMDIDAEVTVLDVGAQTDIMISGDRRDVVAVVFGRAGLLGGAAYTGGRYRRIER